LCESARGRPDDTVTDVYRALLDIKGVTMKILIFGLLSLGATAGSDAPKDQPCGKLVSRKYANQVNPTGDSTERVNRKTKSGKLFYQGDNVLTRNQAEEHNSGVKADGRYRSKRQAIRDRRRMWGNNRVAFFFDDTASEILRLNNFGSKRKACIQKWRKGLEGQYMRGHIRGQLR
uniref:Tox-ART-HYD1 domain-containing protein n=1 Tax=Heligmosomoides polygyrus TaxID=6339 RepID=A0A8L8Q8G5_HELPZ